MQYFEIAEESLQKVIRQGMSLGADYVDIFLQHSASTVVNLSTEGNATASQNITYGAGVRVVSGEKNGYVYTEQISPESLSAAVVQAARICQGAQPTAFVQHCQAPLPSNLYPAQNLTFQPDGTQIDLMVRYLKQMQEELRQRDQRIVAASCSVRNVTSRVAIANSISPTLEEMQPMTTVLLNGVISNNGQTESANCSRSLRRQLDMLTDELRADIETQVLDKLHFALEAQQPKGGEMPVVMAPGASGILLHEAIGHAFEADFIRRGESIFTDRLGQQICDPAITVVDDGLLPDMRGSIHFDDEGVPAQTTEIVSEGRLNSFLHDRISARHFGVEPTGNGRRENFRSIPCPRMRNTYMRGGSGSEQDLIADVRQGIYVKDFCNGQVQIGAGDYTFYVKSGYLIENGRLTQPIKDINVIGNGPQTLADIKAVAGKTVIDPSCWVCGKEGQSMSVSCGMPSVLVSRLTVG